MLQKGHIAQTVTNVTEIDKAMQAYQTANLAYPDYFDSLVAGSGFYSAGPFLNATFSGINGSTPSFTVGQLTQGQVDSLNEAMAGTSLNLTATQTTSGVHLVPMNSAPTDATFDAYAVNANGVLTLPAIQAGQSVAVANDNFIWNVLQARQPTDLQGNSRAIFIALGLGPYCTIVGNHSFGIAAAPICFGEVQSENPKNSYARMICIFRVYNDGTRAEYVGSAHPGHDGLGTAADHIQEYFSTN
jgi:hypothetical protein